MTVDIRTGEVPAGPPVGPNGHGPNGHAAAADHAAPVPKVGATRAGSFAVPGIADHVLVAIPAYNEARFIGSVILQAHLEGFEVVVIDDGSHDGTARIAAAAGALVERHPHNLGKAAALNTAFRIARARNVDALVVLDGDGQHRPDEIHQVLAPVLSHEADIVIGSRFLDPGHSEAAIPEVRRRGQLAITAATNLVSGTPVTDSQSGFRAFSRRAIHSLLFGTHGFNVEVEMQFQARAFGLHVHEMPITAIYADPPKRNVFGQGLTVVHGLMQLIGRHHPLLFFGVPGLCLTLAGLVLGAIVANIYQTTQVLAVGYSLLTLLLIIVGVLSLFTGVLLHSARGAFLDLERRLSALGYLAPPEVQHGG